ncbi:hypothetical protein U4E84_06370 [Halorubrum sp. AD140]|uniref:hypothetical protein n=1 Tax=Halorubrum sp. AD140 TaxID=3050073 RepID=UPI002ACCAFCF|nr:hypothetical protein [Halorubrum sp. AD140]MDZ5810967.1 hypothetical protein [Halorubrum sp. AD140]
MREDELATAVVDHYGAVYDDPEVRLEEPYDAEGRRGVVDAYVRLRTPERVDHVIELKGDAAVRRATGANEILRQYRRMERYFHADARHAIRPKLGRTEPGARFLLLFAPTPTCVYHVATHRSLYGSVDVAARVDDVPAVRTVAFLTGLDGDPADLGMLSVNADARFGSEAFLDAVPPDSRLAEGLRGVDDDLVEFP